MAEAGEPGRRRAPADRARARDPTCDVASAAAAGRRPATAGGSSRSSRTSSANALKFTPGRRHGRDRRPRSTARSRSSPSATTAPGIPADDRARIFERFHRMAGHERITGTGLGLPIARDLARRMGGDLDVASVPGAGSAFVLVLPGPADVDPEVIAATLDRALADRERRPRGAGRPPGVRGRRGARRRRHRRPIDPDRPAHSGLPRCAPGAAAIRAGRRRRPDGRDAPPHRRPDGRVFHRRPRLGGLRG